MYSEEDIDSEKLEVFQALDRLNRYNRSIHKAFVAATCVAAISTLAAVALAIDKWL
jgi:hypothetical protein